MKDILTYLTEKKISREEHKLANEAMGYFGEDDCINLELSYLPVEGTIAEIREVARVFKIEKLSVDSHFRWVPELDKQLSSFRYN